MLVIQSKSKLKISYIQSNYDAGIENSKEGACNPAVKVLSVLVVLPEC